MSGFIVIIQESEMVFLFLNSKLLHHRVHAYIATMPQTLHYGFKQHFESLLGRNLFSDI